MTTDFISFAVLCENGAIIANIFNLVKVMTCNSLMYASKHDIRAMILSIIGDKALKTIKYIQNKKKKAIEFSILTRPRCFSLIFDYISD